MYGSSSKNHEEPTATKSSHVGNLSCYKRLTGEIFIPFFALEEPGGCTLDLNECFRAGNPLVAFILWGFIVSNLIYTWITFETDPVVWFLAYLSTWVQITACVYEMLSLVNNSFVDSFLLMKLTWVLFPVVVVNSAIEVVAFWIWDYNPEKQEINYPTLFSHGIILVILLLDGLILNRVPVRLNHWLFVMAFAVLYIAWLAIQNTVLQYNPASDDDDDAIYDGLKWQKDTYGSLYAALIVVFVVSPAIHFILWGVSLQNRCYELEDEELTDDEMPEIQEICEEAGAEEEIVAGRDHVNTATNNNPNRPDDFGTLEDFVQCLTFSNAIDGQVS